MDVGPKRGILVIEDCAHAAGGEYKGRRAGTLGDIGVFSFHQQKNMVTLGEGGMITTSRKDLYERMLSFRSLCCLTYDPKGKYLPHRRNRNSPWASATGCSISTTWASTFA